MSSLPWATTLTQGGSGPHPLTAAKEIASNAKRTGEVSVTLGANVHGGVNSEYETVRGDVGQELEAELKFTGGAQDILDSGAIESALEGNFSQAYSALEKITRVEATLTPVETDSTELSYKGGDGADSLGVSFSATTVDRQEPIFEYDGTLEKAADELAQAIKQYRHGFIHG